uniref:Uncharacterized protein n=1 Tax=Wuchereria bancrofti TaxID=6293 RepID=A0AAF5PJT0_WUCBA
MSTLRSIDNQKLPMKLKEVPSVLRTLRIRIDLFDRKSIDAVVQVDPALELLWVVTVHRAHIMISNIFCHIYIVMEFVL